MSGRLHFVGLFLITFLMLFLRWGYQYGSGDQVEILPYALKIQNSDLYTNDLFIYHLSDTPFNQRWAIGHLLSWFG
ncbi:hypothetical protein OAD66_09405, partial [Bacteroidia bacterium]|nr:hypothetical protein [Bacteroidia bacterium]